MVEENPKVEEPYVPPKAKISVDYRPLGKGLPPI